MIILPAIIEDTYKEVESKMKIVAPFVDWVQVDVGDGEFVKNKTWTNIRDLASAPTDLKIDLHLMVNDLEEYLSVLSSLPQIRQVTFHFEAVKDIKKTAETIRSMDREVGLAINPETQIDQLQDVLEYTDAVLVMGVHPGWGGQDFILETCDKIKGLKEIWQGGRIGVDGGIHLSSGSAQSAVDAGVDFLVVGSDIFKSDQPGNVIKRLQLLEPSGEF